LVFFVRKFGVVLIYFGLFQNSLFSFYTETESFDREHILVFFRKFWVVLVCFETVLFVLVISIQVRNTETSRNKPKFFVFGYTKQTKTQQKQILFRFVTVRTEIFLGLFSEHPSATPCYISGSALLG
jgi:hypothetical protein